MDNDVRAGQRKRQRLMPPEPVSLDSELDLDYIGRDFMKSDIKSADSRHILFATDEQLHLLSNIRTWYVDGTFDVVRKPFHQLFTVHGFLRSDNCVKQVPLAFVLMSHRRKDDYIKVFKAILDSLPNEANLEEVVCDFEAAIWQAVKECMPDVHLHGCHFHWCQAVYRKVHIVTVVM